MSGDVFHSARPGAAWRAVATGITEAAEFFGPPGERMLGLAHLPTSAASGVLVCSSIQAEFAKNYRREVLLARALARQGRAVGRFHYRGTGNSDGDSLDPILAVVTVGGLAALVASAREASRPFLPEPIAPEEWRRHVFDLLVNGLKPARTGGGAGASV